MKIYTIGFTQKSAKEFFEQLKQNGVQRLVDIRLKPKGQLAEFSKEVYLRVGLARGWKKFPDRCYLQINGIYTFPDYLEGKTYADIAPR